MLKLAESIYKEEKGEDAAEIGTVMKQLGTLYVNRGTLSLPSTLRIGLGLGGAW